jgi:membrane fusion protein (multidrug efflux system)
LRNWREVLTLHVEPSDRRPVLDRPSQHAKPEQKPNHDVLSVGSGQAQSGGSQDRPKPEGFARTDKPKPEQGEPKQDDANGGEPAKDGSQREDKDEHGSIEGARRFIRKHPLAVTIGVVVFLIAVVAGVLYWLHARNYESTDDAFIDARPVSISPEVAGNLVAVAVTDNQVVHAGDMLARIDDRDYRAAVSTTQAQIEQAEAAMTNGNAQISAQQSQIEQTKRQVTEAQAALTFAQDENKRYQDLVQTGAGTVQRAQQAASDLRQRQAQFDAAQAAQAGAEKQIGVLRAQVANAVAQREQAMAQKAQAEANLSRTVLHAPVDGRVTRLTGAVGQVASAQSALMILVPLDIWVTANFKETQLERMKVGQPVRIKVDAYNRTFDGHVNSIQAGSGTAFSLLPAENATGNYEKVVQRVPVKITFDQRPDVLLGPGLSVVPTAKVR